MPVRAQPEPFRERRIKEFRAVGEMREIIHRRDRRVRVDDRPCILEILIGEVEQQLYLNESSMKSLQTFIIDCLVEDMYETYLYSSEVKV